MNPPPPKKKNMDPLQKKKFDRQKKYIDLKNKKKEKEKEKKNIFATPSPKRLK